MNDAFATAHRYHEWVYSSFSKFVSGRILELGTGSGIYTPKLLQHGPVVATDVDKRCLEGLRQRLEDPNLECLKLDLAKPHDFAELRERPCDTAVCLHVLEHVRDDVEALRQLARVLRPDGKLILYVPAMPFLYGTIDELGGHYRRYRKRDLVAKLNKTGFRVVRVRYQNALCMFGWWFNGRVIKQRSLSAASISRQVRFFDRYMLPLTRLIDPLTRRLFGQSLLVIGQRI